MVEAYADYHSAGSSSTHTVTRLAQARKFVEGWPSSNDWSPKKAMITALLANPGRLLVPENHLQIDKSSFRCDLAVWRIIGYILQTPQNENAWKLWLPAGDLSNVYLGSMASLNIQG